ncbi:MAG: methyltransferase domain-containing protein [Burkholderiaceae bacterium]
MTANSSAPRGIDHTPVSGRAAQAYWDIKAATYPRPDEAHAQARAERLRQLALRCGVRFDVARVLDLGAGTGVHAAAIARHAGQVVALDLSATMLEPLARLALPNVETHALDWNEVDLDARGWRENFDLVWAAMTPLAGAPELIAKLEAASRGQCCAITWGGERSDPVIEQAFALHGVAFRAPRWSEALADHLSGREVRRASLEQSSERQIPVADLLADVSAHLRWLGIAPDMTALQAWARAIAIDGHVGRRQRARLDCRVWRVG